jgi:hypothetical protein
MAMRREMINAYAESMFFSYLSMLVVDVRFSWLAMSATVVKSVRSCVENVVRSEEEVYGTEKKSLSSATIVALYS